MLERSIRIPLSALVNEEGGFTLIRTELARVFKDTDISWGRALGQVHAAAKLKAAERNLRPEDHHPGLSDLEIHLSVSDQTGRVKAGAMVWTQPRPQV